MSKIANRTAKPAASKAAKPAAKAVTGDISSKFNINFKMTLAEADKAIQTIVRRGEALRKLAHETACGIVAHYVSHGDFTRMQPLFNAIRGSMSASMARSFVTWVEDHTSLSYETEKPKNWIAPKNNPNAKWEAGFRHDGKDDRINKAQGERGFADPVMFDVPFWEYSPEAEPEAPKALDEKAVLAIIERAVKQLVRLELEKIAGVKVGDKEGVKVPHKVSDGLVFATLALAKDAGLNVGDYEMKLRDAGATIPTVDVSLIAASKEAAKEAKAAKVVTKH